LWAEVPEEFSDGEQFADYLLQEKQVLVTPGVVFGENGKRFVRASFCVNLEKIDQYLP
jgi:aspartate/methionine/tyrosine aminotransferase